MFLTKTRQNMEKQIKWKKYVKKINNLIINEIPNVYLIKKSKNSYIYESYSYYNYQRLRIECIFQRDCEKQRCRCIINNDSEKIFHKTKTTPKRLYQELINYIEYQHTIGFTGNMGSNTVPLIFPNSNNNINDEW